MGYWRYLIIAIICGFNVQYQAQAQNGNNTSSFYPTSPTSAYTAQVTYQDPFNSACTSGQTLNQNPTYIAPGSIQPFSEQPYTPAYNTPTPTSPPAPTPNSAYLAPPRKQPFAGQNTPVTSVKPALRNQAIDLTNQAYRLSKAGNNEPAIELLKQALAIDPNSSVAHLDMSVALIALKRYDEALTESAIVLRLNPDEEKGYLNYLAAAIGANHMQDALRVGQEYLTRFPNGQNRITLANEMSAVAQEIDRRTKIRGIMSPPGAPENYLFLVTPYGKRRWPPSYMPLKVYIYAGQNSRGFLPEYQRTLIAAFMTWQNASHGWLGFIPVNDPAQANIECRWTDSTTGLKLAAEAGDTQIFANRNNIYHARITLLTCRPDLSTEKLTLTLMRQVCLHEIGHALGLDGHSDNAQDIMFCATDPNVERAEISQRDINTLFLIYQ